MSELQLKPCPFCGSSNVSVFEQDEEDCVFESALACCSDCGARSGNIIGENKLRRAAGAWNRRAEGGK